VPEPFNIVSPAFPPIGDDGNRLSTLPVIDIEKDSPTITLWIIAIRFYKTILAVRQLGIIPDNQSTGLLLSHFRQPFI
jgi:hypothetical protein